MTRTTTLAGYAAIVLAAVVLEVTARRTGRVARFRAALDAAVGRPLLRVALMAAWLWLGWHVFVRVSWR